MKLINKIKISIIGMGYVGLPLAIAFSRYFNVIGFDINLKRVSELQSKNDLTKEVTSEELNCSNVCFTNDIKDLQGSDVYIVTVPTPINSHNLPDLTPLISASEIVGSSLQKNAYVIYESTVFPGCTEEICLPILEKSSDLKINQDFFIGYSPERINPGDKSRRLKDIKKITSGSTPEAAKFIDYLYAHIIEAGTYMAESIKVAEAAKVIENTQRDLNIALVNELSMIFSKLGIDTQAVLTAAGTKWNFLKFFPGLVGGHCIGVDPYYLTFKSQEVGYDPQVILAGRRVNDGMASYVVNQLIKTMIKRSIAVRNSNVLIMGFTFKENCPDIRNSKVVDIVTNLLDYEMSIDIFDPVIEDSSVVNNFSKLFVDKPKNNKYDAIILTVAHDEFKALSSSVVRGYGKDNCIIYDLKYLYTMHESDLRL
jgi:UDP-N-acetyl-D-galactosamine dehydrogenase